MLKPLIKSVEKQTFSEEIANTVIHGLGALLSVTALIVLTIYSSLYGDALKIVSCVIYGTSLILMYFASTLYHGFRQPGIKRVFRILDHSAIYLLIAGSYTPFLLISIPGAWGTTLFVVIWSLAFAGLFFKYYFINRFKALSIGIYLVMGWSALIAIMPLYHALSFPAMMWLVAGGLCYTVGVIFYVIDHKIHFTHAIWHLFVLAGSICHFIAIFCYVIYS